MVEIFNSLQHETLSVSTISERKKSLECHFTAAAAAVAGCSLELRLSALKIFEAI